MKAAVSPASFSLNQACSKEAPRRGAVSRTKGSKPAKGEYRVAQWLRAIGVLPSEERGRADAAAASVPSDRELPDVTGVLVLLVVTLGLFVVPVGATLMQGPAILAGLLSGG